MLRNTGRSLALFAVGFIALAQTASAEAGWRAFDLGTLGNDSVALDVNNSGQVVGYSFIVGDSYHAFSWTRKGGMIDLHTLGGSHSQAFDVNDSGQVVGFMGYPAHAFSWTEAGGMIDLGTLGGSSSGADAVNDSGWVVGSAESAGGPSMHAALWVRRR